METVKVQWQARQGEWLITTADAVSLPLPQWADALPDLTPVRLILSAANYATHWLSLPGVNARHLSRALPFALEESLIDDVTDYLIVPAGSADKKIRAYVVADELLERLLDACSLHHLQVREVIPETALLGSDNLMQRVPEGWLTCMPGQFEGLVSDAALTPVLESLFDGQAVHLPELVIRATQMDQAQLLQTTLETSFPGQIQAFRCDIMQPQSAFAVAGKPCNLLTGRFQVKLPPEQKQTRWWAVPAGMAAAWLLIWTAGLILDVQRLQGQSAQAHEQTISLYQSLFPGERIRALERQIREKIEGGNHSGEVDFLRATYTLAQVHQQEGLQKQVQITSLRFNDRLQELMVEVQAAGLNELQLLRQALENAGLTAEISSATNDNTGVKGRIRIGGNV